MPSTEDLRISFRVKDKQDLYELRELLEYGQQQLIFNAVTKDIIRLLKSPKRHIIIGLLCSGDLKLEDYSKKLIEHKEELK